MRAYDPHDWYWIVAADETHVYASARGAYVASDDAAYRQFIDTGNVVTRIASESDLIGVLRNADMPPYHRVKTATIVARLRAVDGGGALFNAAHQAILGNAALFWRFITAPDGAIGADDPDARAFLTAVGADPAAILAPGD